MTYDPTTWVDYGIPCIEAATLKNAEDGIDRAQGDIMVLRGATAAIPASDPLLIGRLYFEDDLLERAWRDNGAGWDQVNAPAPYPALLLETGQTTCYVVGDDGDVQAGEAKGYTVTATPGNTDIEVAHYAAATISYTAPNTIADAANGLAGWAVNDRMVIKGSASNDGEVTVTGIGGAPANLTISAAVNEIAGAMISLYKVAAHSNNVVTDDNTGLMWSRATSTGEAVGAASNGTLTFYNVAWARAIYAGANTVSVIMPGNIFRITGGAALTQFHVGDLIQCTGLANPVNGLVFMYVVSVTPNGPDLDIVIDSGNQVLIAEGAVGDTIYLNCQSVYNYAAGARSASLSTYTDWRVPNIAELASLADGEAPTALPDAVSFPTWTGVYHWSSSTNVGAVNNANLLNYNTWAVNAVVKTGVYVTALVRLGI